MKKKTIIQQPFKKPEPRKQIIIKIKSPTSYQSSSTDSKYFRKEREPLAVTRELINQIQAHVKYSEEVISLSKKQAQSPKKIVGSDYIPLNFKYQSPKNGYEKVPLFRLDQRDSQYSESQGSIQLPLHFETTRQQDTFVTDKSIDRPNDWRNSERMYFSDRNNMDGRYQQEDMSFYLNIMTNSLEKKQFTPRQSYQKQIKREKTEENQTNIRSFKSNSNQKDHKIHKALHKKAISHHQRGFEGDKIKYYQNSILDKQFLPSQSIGQQLKIKINRAPKVKLLKTTNAFSKKEKISIKMPQLNIFDSIKSVKSTTASEPVNQWQSFKQQLQRYQFIKKYLIQSDIFEMYTFLMKNNIQRDKWPLFAVDQAYKRMNLHKY